LLRFSLHIQEKDEVELRPVFTEDGITYIYIKVHESEALERDVLHQLRTYDLFSYSAITFYSSR
jgi:hypothetical protein